MKIGTWMTEVKQTAFKSESVLGKRNFIYTEI